jgi:hypothetical protein
MAWGGCLQLVDLEGNGVQVSIPYTWVYSRRVRSIAELSVDLSGQSMREVPLAQSS